MSPAKKPTARTPRPRPGPRGPTLAAAQALLRRGAWSDACAAFEQLAARERGGPVLEGLASALWWLDEPHRSLEAREAAYRAYRDAGDARAAARMAMRLGIDSVDLRNDFVALGGWMARAEELLAPLGDTVEHGWLALWASHGARLQGDLGLARTSAARAQALARRFDDPDLQTLTAAADGLRLIAEGALDTGLRQLDAATTTAIAGDVREIAAVGHTCCFLIHACTNVRDYERALRWSERILSFSERWQVRPLFSTCRTYYATVLMWRGEWAAAERELGTAIAAAGPRTYMAAAAEVRLGELRRRQGRVEDAQRLWAPHDSHPVALLGRAWVEADAGRLDEAAALADRACRRFDSGQVLDRAAALLLRLRVLCRLGRLDEAEGLHRELAALAASAPMAAMRATGHQAAGLVASAAGRHGEACVAFEDALDTLAAADVPYDIASIRVDLARALHAAGRKGALAELSRAVEALAALGASADAGRARALGDAWTAGTGQVGTSARATTSGPVLTARERDVLRLVADGLSDRRIAARLSLSEHTVHRHVANILTRLGVNTRSAAVAHATRARLL